MLIQNAGKDGNAKNATPHGIKSSLGLTAPTCPVGIWGVEPIPSQAHCGHARYTVDNRAEWN